MAAYNHAREVLGDSFPICDNGDITSVRSYLDKSEEIGFEPAVEQGSSCDAFMIGRGVIMNPELPGNIKNYSGESTGLDNRILPKDILWKWQARSRSL